MLRINWKKCQKKGKAKMEEVIDFYSFLGKIGHQRVVYFYAVRKRKKSLEPLTWAVTLRVAVAGS